VYACSRKDTQLGPNKSLDVVIKLIVTLLHDVQTSHGAVFNCKALRLTTKVVQRRALNEGIGFFTKTLPSLGKALDRALCENTPLTAATHRFQPMKNSELPRFLGELFSKVFSPKGELLRCSCVLDQKVQADCVRSLRLILYSFYKYKLPYEDKECEKVIQQFERTEDELGPVSEQLSTIRGCFLRHSEPENSFLVWRPSRNCDVSLPIEPLSLNGKEHLRVSTDGTTFFGNYNSGFYPLEKVGGTRAEYEWLCTIRSARKLLAELFADFDPMDIYPRHGPGAVATKQQLSDKYRWTNISANITSVYPLDAYFFASLGHVCDAYRDFESLTDRDLPARVVLVPKDSRGPRLISCEPVDYQWVQQGLGSALVRHLETHSLSREHVRFTSQRTNQLGALLGSSTGKYVTLDLKEASDRVTVELVRLLYPDALVKCLLACRSSSTELPSGKVLPLRKFAPMGSSLCFPIMATTIWALLHAGAPDTYTRDRIAVYGDDVIVPTAYAENAIELLESVGLKINRDKSCISGLFRESCGTDAFNGYDVTPVRFRTVWSSSRQPDVLASWCEYANNCYDARLRKTFQLIADWLVRIYGYIPDESTSLKRCPYLRVSTDDKKPVRSRTNFALQKREILVWDVQSPIVKQQLPGWSMLLRHFAEARHSNDLEVDRPGDMYYLGKWWEQSYDCLQPFSVRQYTRRRASMLVRRWR